MQKIRFKGNVSSKVRYSIALGSIAKDGSHYCANLALQDRHKPYLHKAISDFNIKSTDKKILLKHVHDIVNLYPPEQDLDILFYDMEELKE